VRRKGGTSAFGHAGQLLGEGLLHAPRVTLLEELVGRRNAGPILVRSGPPGGSVPRLPSAGPPRGRRRLFQKSAESASTRRSALARSPWPGREHRRAAGLLAGLGIQALLERLLPGRDGVTFAFQALFPLTQAPELFLVPLSSEERRACSWA